MGFFKKAKAKPSIKNTKNNNNNKVLFVPKPKLSEITKEEHIASRCSQYEYAF